MALLRDIDELAAAAPFAVFAPEHVPAQWSCLVWFNGDVAGVSYHDESENGAVRLSVLLAQAERHARFGSPEDGPPWHEVVQDGVTYRQRGPDDDDEWPSPEYGGRWCEVYCEAAGTTIGLGSNDLEPATLLTLARTMRRVHG